MEKFEEELKRPVIGIEQSSIKPSLGKAIEFYTDKVKEYHNAFNEMNKYIDTLEAQLDYYKKDKRFEVMAEEILSLKSQLEKQKPEIPEFVATEIERLKNDGAKTLSELYSADIKWLTYGTTYLNGNDLKLAEWFYDNTETFELAFIHGYTGAKEKRFYLKHIDMSKADKNYDWYITRFNKGLAHEAIDKERVPEGLRFKFTQQKIDSMETGSYEQIEVEE